MLNPDYIVGLVDGEGSFTIYIRNPDTTKVSNRRVVAEPKFYLKLVEKDKDILYQLKNFFGCGNVYFQKDNRSNHQNCYRYEVFNWGQLEKIIIPFFKKNRLKLKSKKKDFKIFCNLFNRLLNKEHLKKPGLKRLYQIKQLMH
ncbi:MAG TPA: LAGLIDADG family homing endonuclease [Candidatus Paceibacterota bacterium]